jgi:hypothetical protein
MHEIKTNLENFISDKGVMKVLQIEKNALNGLQGILSGCSWGKSYIEKLI